MKKLQAIVSAFVLAALLCTSCSKDETEGPIRPPRPEIADQTIMFYMVGTDLTVFFRKNIDDAISAVSKDILHNSRVLIFTEPTENLSLVVELSYDPETKDCVSDTLRRWTNEDFRSTAGSTITEVVTYMAAQAPAQRYGLIMGSHAQGWMPSGSGLKSISSIAAYEDFWRPMPGALLTRWFGKDKSRVTEIPELKTALKNTNLHLEYLIFDACFMSSIEALYELRGSADNIIASPCETMATGFPYTTVLPSLLTDNGKGYDLNKVCFNFHDFYANRTPTRKSGCIAQTVCKELEPLAAIVKRIEASSPNKFNANLLQAYEGLTMHVFFDLQDYIWTICSDPALRDEFDLQMAKTFPVVNRLHTPSFYSMYGMGDTPDGMHTVKDTTYSGVTTSAPSTRFILDWKETSWYEATH